MGPLKTLMMLGVFFLAFLCVLSETHLCIMLVQMYLNYVKYLLFIV